jgi:cholesterol transport system auxiliary component
VRRIATLLAAACLCTACVGSALRSDADVPDRYQLQGPPAEPGGAMLPLAIAVAMPRASSSLDTDRIAVTTPGHGFDYLAGARWADPAPQMLQRLLVDALAGNARFATAVASPSRVPTDLLLDVELGRFEAAYSDLDAPPTIVVEIGVNLVDARQGLRIASFRSTASVVAGRNDRSAVVAAFEQATDQAVRDAVNRIAAVATPKSG